MTENKSNSLTWVLGGALVLIGLIVIIMLVNVRSQADSSTTSLSVTNVAPTVDSVLIDDDGSNVAAGGNVTLNSGATELITITGVVSDANGVGGSTFAAGDLASIYAWIWRGPTPGSGCKSTSGANDDGNNCYTMISDSSNTPASGKCVITSQASSTSVNYECRVEVFYWADATDGNGVAASSDKWSAFVEVKDDSNSSATDSKDFEIVANASLTYSATIPFGTLALAEKTTASNNVAMTVTQNGNDIATTSVSGTAMSCTVGTVPVGNIEWALTDVAHSNVASTDLSATPTNTAINVTYRTDESTANTSSLYWNIEVPATGVSGSCSGTNTLTASGV